MICKMARSLASANRDREVGRASGAGSLFQLVSFTITRGHPLSGALMRTRPGDRVLQPIVAPEQLAADDEGRRTEDAEALCLLGLLHQQGSRRPRLRQRKNARRILSDLAQAVRGIG